MNPAAVLAGARVLQLRQGEPRGVKGSSWARECLFPDFRTANGRLQAPSAVHVCMPGFLRLLLWGAVLAPRSGSRASGYPSLRYRIFSGKSVRTEPRRLCLQVDVESGRGKEGEEGVVRDCRPVVTVTIFVLSHIHEISM